MESIDIPDIIKAAQDKRFSDFEGAVRTQLQNRIANSPEIVQYNSVHDKMQRMKDLFQQASSIGSEKI